LKESTAKENLINKKFILLLITKKELKDLFQYHEIEKLKTRFLSKAKNLKQTPKKKRDATDF